MQLNFIRLKLVRPAGVEPHSVARKGLPKGGLPPLASPPMLRGILPPKPMRSWVLVLITDRLSVTGYRSSVILYGAPGGSRTHDLWLRRPTLYPAELRAHLKCGMWNAEFEFLLYRLAFLIPHSAFATGAPGRARTMLPSPARGSPGGACPLWYLPRNAGEPLPCTPQAAGD
jgi:hypothetical protein